jgi:hypothetical protein
VRFRDDATTEELRQEIMRRIAVLTEAGVIDLQALPVPKRRIANYPIHFRTVFIANCVKQPVRRSAKADLRNRWFGRLRN